LRAASSSLTETRRKQMSSTDRIILIATLAAMAFTLAILATI
jgi:hypothetical protein